MILVIFFVIGDFEKYEMLWGILGWILMVSLYKWLVMVFVELLVVKEGWLLNLCGEYGLKFGV